MFFWLSFYLFFFLLTAFIGYRKGHLIAGILLGYVLGPVGLCLILLSKNRMKLTCPHCHTLIHKDSYFCPNCEKKVLHSLV
ncbi:hypothetical protein GNP89_05710 [Aliivibrio fischeri]|uniref:hypothetical protein n=1 Tax=Aliivibrio fischeri TaxID=668 RepID=UPI0012D8738C|nr:hypothetical protein [Aliivibrio fischeri]MUL01709.1 hypothetical protein [Aliivibrio fischeri]